VWESGAGIRWGSARRERLAGIAGLVALPFALGAWLASPIAAAAGGEAAQAPARAFELRIERRQVPQAQRTLRVTEGERVELRWAADEALVLHLHGYDIETRVAPGRPAVTSFAARLTGRFPVEIHAAGGAARPGSRHDITLLHVEVYPR
jgi:hypothetical protein